jgi:hypothetical protein
MQTFLSYVKALRHEDVFPSQGVPDLDKIRKHVLKRPWAR